MPNDKHTVLKYVLTMSRSETCDINLHALCNTMYTFIKNTILDSHWTKFYT